MRCGLFRDWIRRYFRSKALVLDKIQWKYDGNKPSLPAAACKLGEIVYSAASSTYFTELARFISTLFLSYFACLPQAGSSYFVLYSISSILIPQLKHPWTCDAYTSIWSQNSKLRHHDAFGILLRHVRSGSSLRGR